MKGAVSNYVGGNALITEFVSFLHNAESEEALMSAWDSFQTKYPDVPRSSYKYVLVMVESATYFLYATNSTISIHIFPYFCRRLVDIMERRHRWAPYVQRQHLTFGRIANTIAEISNAAFTKRLDRYELVVCWYSLIEITLNNLFCFMCSAASPATLWRRCWGYACRLKGKRSLRSKR